MYNRQGCSIHQMTSFANEIISKPRRRLDEYLLF